MASSTGNFTSSGGIPSQSPFSRITDIFGTSVLPGFGSGSNPFGGSGGSAPMSSPFDQIRTNIDNVLKPGEVPDASKIDVDKINPFSGIGGLSTNSGSTGTSFTGGSQTTGSSLFDGGSQGQPSNFGSGASQGASSNPFASNGTSSANGGIQFPLSGSSSFNFGEAQNNTSSNPLSGITNGSTSISSFDISKLSQNEGSSYQNIFSSFGGGSAGSNPFAGGSH